MYVIALVCQKGGAGKTTIAVHLAVEAERLGYRTTVIDIDPQASAAKILDRRGELPPDMLPEHAARLEATVAALGKEGVDLVIIDTAPQADQAAIKAARVADLVLVPVRPSVVDLDAVDATLEVCRLVRKEPLFVLNAVSPQGQEAQAAERVIRSRDARVCDVRLGDRKVFRAAFNDGATAGEIEPDSKAASEIRRLFKRIPLPAPSRVAMPACSQEGMEAR